MRTPNPGDIDYIPFSPVRVRDDVKGVVRTDVHTALEEARSDGVSGSQAGHKATASGLPEPVFATPVAFPYLQDLIPNRQQLGRMVNLHTTDERSASMGLTLSYPELGPLEQVPFGYVFPSDGNIVASRDHAAWLRFGAGGANHHVEFDCGEGNCINVPGSTVEVTLVDWTFYRQTAVLFGTPPKLTSYASASSNALPGHAIFTTRVMTFYQVELDLLAPPTIEAFKAQLLEAATRALLLD